MENKFELVKEYYLKGYSLPNIVEKIRTEKNVRIGKTNTQIIINQLKVDKNYYITHKNNSKKIISEKLTKRMKEDILNKHNEAIIKHIENYYRKGLTRDQIAKILRNQYNFKVNNSFIQEIINRLKNNPEIVTEHKFYIKAKRLKSLNYYYRKRLINCIIKKK